MSVANYDFSVVCLEFGDNNAKVPCTRAMEYCAHTRNRERCGTEQSLSWQKAKDETVPGDPEPVGPALVVTYRVFYLQVVKKEKGN